ncbi:hypothetical protein HMPREF0262_00166 [Clostridium sp. ATCC 29733]|nr:hypothetical protein HMPREF0262_00166 [Clostridium sp. ATCC 29733]
MSSTLCKNSLKKKKWTAVVFSGGRIRYNERQKPWPPLGCLCPECLGRRRRGEGARRQDRKPVPARRERCGPLAGHSLERGGSAPCPL